MTFFWSKGPFIYGFIYSLLVCAVWYFLEININIPWQPISVIGIAVAFYLGFKNNSSYDRTWEARKIWGGIVNNSRSFGVAVVSFVHGHEHQSIQRELIYRHLAWVTALRYQLRLARPWEHAAERLQNLFSADPSKDYRSRLVGELKLFLSENELMALEGSTNWATQILKNQSIRLQELKDQGIFEDFRHMEFFQLIRTFYDDQGGSERIKNFPFPRQYASTALWLNVVFCAFVPLGLIEVFAGMGPWMLLMCPFVSSLLIWIFFLMEKIGDYSENPFEGTYNDVPITSISRGIEIDLREMIQDEDIPPPTEAENGFLL